MKNRGAISPPPRACAACCACRGAARVEVYVVAHSFQRRPCRKSAPGSRGALKCWQSQRSGSVATPQAEPKLATLRLSSGETGKTVILSHQTQSRIISFHKLRLRTGFQTPFFQIIIIFSVGENLSEAKQGGGIKLDAVALSVGTHIALCIT